MEETLTSFLLFATPNVKGCIDINDIDKIMPLAQIEPIPNAQKCCVGLLNLAEECIPILDFELSVGIDRQIPYSTQSSIILIKKNNKKMGIIVDTIQGISLIDKSNLTSLDNKPNSPFKGSLNNQGNLSLLVNPDYFCQINYTKGFEELIP